ncbi:isoleucine--tRNA ligase [Desulfobacterota bacterium M19]
MDYKSTLNLPKTKFKMKANLAQREPEFLKQWQRDDLYAKVQKHTAGRPAYILHDGPPYANGHIHIGHALNKILKDIILRSKRMSGFHCAYIPGWDCHGLPIEHNVDEELGEKKRRIPLLSFRKACRDYAGKWVKIQRDEFKRLGVLGDWDNPYLTIDYRYEAATAREFNRFLTSGSVMRSKKPVYWCSSCQTALAEAEVDYADISSPSIYVKFPVLDDLGDIDPLLTGDIKVIIWTTTPWTLPANLAVAMHPDFVYAAVKVAGEVWIMAEERIEAAMAEFEISVYEILTTFSARKLERRHCRHPFLERDSLIVLADYVTLDTGTGCVHTAPGHGREDYLTGVRYGLDILSPVDSRGRFTEEAGVHLGMDINEANEVICADLERNGSLVRRAAVSHSYPHCWRCKKPVIFRATEQWFIGMANNDLRRKALAAVHEVKWTPRWGMNRIYGMVESRPDWCLSRQRSWGVPITAIICVGCGEIINDTAINGRIDELFLKEGADAWFSHDIKDFVGDRACGKCGGTEFTREKDILDVWFDSGTSFAAVLEDRDELSAPADLYLEGSDQHRGWFQSSLLAAVGTRGVPPYRAVLTHGFVVDDKGRKMSKSVGNVVAPETVIKKYGAELLRLWVAAEDYRDEIKISDKILSHLSDSYRKVRNTIRYFLGNLSDFEPQHRVAYADLPEIDRWALSQFEQLRERFVKAYEDFEFHIIFHGLQNFCAVTMSSFYLDIIKDRLYTAAGASRERRAAQTVLYELTEGLLRLMAPVLAFTVAEAWGYLPFDPEREKDPAMASFPAPRPEYRQPELDEKWGRLTLIRRELTKALEIARINKVIGHSLEARVMISASGELAEFIADKRQLLEDIAIVSQLEFSETSDGEAYESAELDGLRVLVSPAAGRKCERCWTRSETVGENTSHPTICERCAGVMLELEGA